MTTTPQTYDLIHDLVQDVQADQTTARRKANTVTTGIGGVATAVAAGLTYVIENGTSLPSWVTLVVMVCGLLSTTFAVSRTRNGVTDSVSDVLRDALVEKIDRAHDHVVPAGSAGPESSQTPVDELLQHARELGQLHTGSVGLVSGDDTDRHARMG